MYCLLERVHYLWDFVGLIELVHCWQPRLPQLDYLFVVEYEICRRSMKNEIPHSRNDNQSVLT